MTEEEKKKTLKELYASFLSDLEHLDRERLSFMKRVVERMEKKRTDEVMTRLNA